MVEAATAKAPHSDDAAPPFPNPTAHVEFYKLFKRESDEFDNEFIKKFDDDVNITLIFAGLFSAVTSAFIIDVQSQLQPDYTQMSYTLLTIIASAQLGQIPTGPDAAFPQWNGPDPTVVHVQSILYASLSASLLAAFVAMLGKQWLNRFSRADVHGSIAERSRDRVRKSKGMKTWHFDLVMESLPIMLQLALFLFGYALSNYLFFLNKTVAAVIIGFTAFGLLFFVLIVSAATLSYACPFQTPLSLIIRFVIRFDDEHKEYLKKCKERIGYIFYWMRRLPRPGSGGSNGPGTPGRGGVYDHIELAIAGPLGQKPPLDYRGADGDRYVLDSDCIARVFEISTDPDVIQANMKFIPEIVWHSGIRTTPLERLYSAVLECFDNSTGRLAVIPKLRNQAYLSAKALLHLLIQRQCFGDGSDNPALESVSARHQVMGSVGYEGDSDLESTLSIIDHVLNKIGPIWWPSFSPTHTHLAWMAHTLLFRAWDFLRKGKDLPGDIKEFILHCFGLESPLPAPVVTDCLFIIGLVLGINLHIDDLLVIDKSHEKERQVGRIYDKLVGVFKNPDSTADEIDRALRTMELTAPLSENDIATKSYHLFRVVMQAPVAQAYTKDKKWAASRFAIHGAYKWDRFLPWVEDPQDILAFLDHHFDLATRGEDQGDAIQNALRALAYASSNVTIEALKFFDPTEPSFVRGICYVFQDNKPLQLRKAALLFLPFIGDRLFNTPHPIMEDDQMRSLCVDWASAVDDIEHTHHVQKATLTVLFGMINSPYWRPHIVTEKWKLLGYFTSVPDDSQPLRRCLDNPELTDAISKVGNPAAIVLWLAILWLKYKELSDEVRDQLETATKEVAQSGRADLDTYLSVVDSALGKAEDARMQHNAWSVDPAAIALRAEIDNLQQARVALLSLCDSSRISDA